MITYSWQKYDFLMSGVHFFDPSLSEIADKIIIFLVYFSIASEYPIMSSGQTCWQNLKLKKKDE